MSTSKSAAYHHGDLRAALIDAALAILAEGGEAADLSLREAARRAGVSAMAPYRHFDDKDALLAAVATAGFARLADACLAADDAQTDAKEALIGQGLAYVDFAIVHPALFRLMFGRALAERHNDLTKTSDTSYAVMSRRVASLVPPSRVVDGALRCWIVVHGIASLAIDGQFGRLGKPVRDLAERLLRQEVGALVR